MTSIGTAAGLLFLLLGPFQEKDRLKKKGRRDARRPLWSPRES